MMDSNKEKQKKWLRECVEKGMFKARHPCLGDDENELESICRNPKHSNND